MANTPQDNEQKLASIKRYAKFLDSQFKIPFTNFRFGLDPLLSLVPTLGTFSGLITGFYLVILAHLKGASGRVKSLMVRNVVIDYIYGLVPVLGNVKDFFYKSNEKNVKLLEEHWLQDMHQGPGSKLIILMLIIAIVAFVASLVLFAFVIHTILSWTVSIFNV